MSTYNGLVYDHLVSLVPAADVGNLMDAWQIFLETLLSLPVDVHNLNDRQYEYFGDLLYTGALDDRMRQWELDNGLRE